jgi:murein DD-endopeptidase MepM/ murein hydrolase activator NlpD
VKRVLALATLLALAACGDPPRSAPRSLPPVVNEAPPANVGGSYLVKPGDTIYSIARELHVSVRSLIDTNQLQAPFNVTPGQRLVLPGSGFYIVAKGDNLSMIAKKTGVPFGTLARTNNLAAPYVLQVGQKLVLPAAAPSAPPPATVVASAAPPLPAAAPLPPAVTSAPLPAPPGAASAPVSAPQVVSVSPNAAPAAAVPVPGPAPIAPAAATPPVSAPISTPTQTAALPPAPLPAPPAQSGHGFIWPLKGDVILDYGTTGHGQHNDGINIAAARGTPVMAAESGVVAYAGNELRGFGNLLLIKHEGGWMTAYAHNDALLVKRGDVVKRGQKIAKVGDSGGVSQPQLHFEVRQGTRAVDPATVLGAGSIPASAPLDPPDPG